MNLRACVGFVVLLLPSIAHGQIVSGRVTDQARGAVSRVAVTAVSDAPGEASRTVLTDPEGRYRFANLRPLIYRLAFSLSGGEPFAHRVVDLTRARSATVDIAVATGRPGRSAALRAPSGRSRPDSRSCLHDEEETSVEAARRDDALETLRLIDSVLSVPTRDRTWETLARSTAVAELRSAAGPKGDLARKVQWGSSEPLPGWGLAYVTSGGVVRYALTDLRDPCAFAYSSADPDLFPDARIVPQR